MGYPNGVSLAVVSGGTAFTAFGDDVPVQITVTPRFPKQGGGFLTRIVHADTGWVMTSDPDTFTADAGTEVSFSVPHVDQAGFRDPAQNAYTGWYYEVKVVVGAARGRTKTSYTQTVSPVVGQALVDLDLVPEGQAGSPQSVAVPEVLSVNGMTGAVNIDAGATDAQVSGFISDPGTVSNAAVTDIVEAAPRGDKGDAFMAKVDTGIGNTVLAILGDSTGNADDEWVRLTANQLGADHPSMRIQYYSWNSTNQAYNTVVEIQPGEDQSGGLLIHDTFERTGDLYGSAPSVSGGTWGGPSSSAGDWTLDGTAAVRTDDATSAEIISDTGAAGDQLVTANVSLTSIGGAATRLFRLYGKYLDSSNHIAVQISVSTTGTVTWTVWARVAGTVTTIVNGYSNPFPASTELSTFDVILDVVGTAVTATVNDNTITGTITQETADALAQASGAGFSDNGTGTNKVNDFKVTVTPTVASVQTLTIYNGSEPGSRLDYQSARLDTMLPVEPDLVILSSCHNYGSTPPDEYVGIVESFVGEVRAKYPRTGIAVSSQNPQKPPATNRVPHANRLIALRPAALRRGWGYVPAFEAFRARPDRGADLVASDGVHPTPAGSALWEDAATAYFASLSYV